MTSFKCFLQRVLFCFCASWCLLVLVGCAKQREVSAEPEVEEVKASFTYLENVNTPVFDEQYAVLLTDTAGRNVEWGTSSSNNAYFNQNSGFPGFGYPICIMNCDLASDRVCLKTLYGEYVYTYLDTISVIVDGNNIKRSNGEKLINFYKLGEQLFLIHGNTAIIYAYDSGTFIIAEDADAEF